MADNEAGPNPRNPNGRMPNDRWLSAAAFIIGFLLVACAIFVEFYNFNLSSRLLLFGGVAAFFSGIGAEAAVQFNLGPIGKVSSATGALAIAIVLAWSFDDSDRFVRGSINVETPCQQPASGPNSSSTGQCPLDPKVTQIIFSTGLRAILTGRNFENRNFPFDAFESDLTRTGSLKITVQTRNGEAEYSIYCISPKVLTRYLGVRREPIFRIDIENLQLVDEISHTREGQGSSRCSGSNRNTDTSGMSSVINAILHLSVWPIGQVWAQAPTGQSIDVEQAIKDLQVDSLDVRQSAVEALAKLVTQRDNIGAIVAKWDLSTSSPRLDLGLLRAFGTALERKPGIVVDLAEALGNEKLRYLIDLMGHSDRSIRIAASDVLIVILDNQSKFHSNNNIPRETWGEIYAPLNTSWTRSMSNAKTLHSFQPDRDKVIGNAIISLRHAKCGLTQPYRNEIQQALVSFQSGNSSHSYPATRDLIRQYELASC